MVSEPAAATITYECCSLKPLQDQYLIQTSFSGLAFYDLLVTIVRLKLFMMEARLI